MNTMFEGFISNTTVVIAPVRNTDNEGQHVVVHLYHFSSITTQMSGSDVVYYGNITEASLRMLICVGVVR